MIYMDDYKIRLGVELDTSDIISEINKAESKVDPIKIKVDAETKELTKSIQDALKSLSKGTQNALTLDTTKVEGSLKEVTTIIKEIRTAMGSLDSGSGMKSLVGSINSISTALDKASNKFDELVSDLKSLSGKDFNLNFGINLGGSNSVARQGIYGSHVRSETLPELKKQAKALQDYFKEYYNVQDELSAIMKLAPNHGGTIVDLYAPMSGYKSKTEKESLSKQMGAYREYINIIKEAASLRGIDISHITDGFSKSADQLVKDAEDIQTGAKEMDESFDKLKQIFSGGGNLNIQELSVQLDPIVQDLKQIREAVQNLSKGVSLDGLTSSFDRLSGAIENLLANAEKVKGVLGSGFDVNGVSSTSTSTPSSTSVITSAQQTGKKIGETVKQSVKQSLNLDDVIDEQVLELMQQYGIAGKKGSQAFNEIRQAIIEYRAQLSLLSSDNVDDDFIEIFDNDDIADIRKVTDALTSNMKVADQAKDVYEDLVQYIKQINNSGHKVYLPDTIRQEYGDDFRSMRSQLGKAFTTSQSGVDFEVWVMELNEHLGNVIDLSHGAEAAFGDLVKKVQMGRDNGYLSGDDLVKSGILDMEGMEIDIINALGLIEGKERHLAEISNQTTNDIIQDEERKQQAYKATTDTVLYHAGVVSKLNKAETNGRFYGSNRGTGYFGTGHYFVDSATKHELDNNGHYNKLPYTSVDISQYDNLFKATTDEVADRLHTFLANLTSFTQGSDNYDVSELFAQFKSVFGDTIMDVKEFGSRLDQLKTFMSNSSLDDRSDSVSTQFMKSLGYEGVDTRGTKFADTRYGTVIYDLKEESILQANITDELQKQGQMLEKINYAKGQAFDKDTDARIQNELDAQAKKREIANEFKNSFDTSGFDKADADLTAAQNRLREIDEIIQSCQYSINNADQEAKKFARVIEDIGLGYTDDEVEDYKRRFTESYQSTIDELSQEKAELQSKIPILEETYNKESQLANEVYKQAEQTVEQRHREAQQAQETANTVVQSEEKKQQAYRETADAYEKISRDASLTRDAIPGADFQKVFEASSQAAQEAQRHFQELLADEKAVVSVTEQFGDDNALQSFTVNIKRATGEVETLRYAMDKLDDGEGFVYQGGSASDSRVEKQLETRIKKANELQTKLDKIRSGYKDANASKPIKDDDHIRDLDVQYRKVEKAIVAVRNADDSTFSSMIANAEKEKAVLESMIREYRNAENVATSLRSKDISTVKDTYASKLDVLVSKMKSSGVYTDGFEKGAENLRSVLSDATDASGLVKFLNGLDKLEAGYKRADAAAKEFNRSQKVGINTSGLESKIADLQRISPEIDKFEAEIDGAKVSVKSLIDDLQQVKTQGDFSVVNARFKAFTDAAKAAGIAVTEVAQKAKSINDIKIKISDTGFNGFEQEVLRARNAAEELEGFYPDLEAALKRLDTAIEDVYSADQAGDVKRLVAANEEYEASLKQVYSQLKLYQQEEQKAYKTEMLNQKKSALSSEMETWLKENTRAARDFGEEIRRLQASLNGLDDKGVKLVGQQFKAITKQAQAMGKTGLTVFDRLKSKIKEYSSYLSAAELFMYAEQAMRSMFEQVKLIDSAMTELKKVTDETDASYNQFLSNAASRSKELGTTIDGLVSSTADFARLGYSFEDSQGLAEVANVYAVVGDEIEGVEGATESLISTMAAFKDEMNGMSNSDFAMRIIDSFNELGNNFAISSGGIGEALERSASSLAAANNNLHESAALITAAM